MKHRINPRLVSTLLALLLGLTLCCSLAAAELDDQDPTQRADVRAFIQEMQQKHGFDARSLTREFKQVRMRQKIIDAITRPAEAKPWHKYRPIFVTPSRIKEGVTFWNDHDRELRQAEKTYGVPPEIIVAIIGVETRYGRHTGGYRVMDSLSTLAFNYPKRAKFFRNELAEYLLLTREEGLDPLAVKGSYAGAMGKAQFISSSYRNFAVDFNHDGRRDLWNDSADAIGSVANYFKRHQWQPGQPVIFPVPKAENRPTYALLAEKGYKPHTPIRELAQKGILPPKGVDPATKAALIELDTRQGAEYWLGLDNFYVITRYNHSPLYAMAVYQLGQAIRSRREGST
jgi:membrane-bound lytic murein transglycosylase B